MANIGGVFYAEFDNIVGPKIVYQSPDGFFDPEDFDAVSEYMITKPDLCGKVVSVLHSGFRAGPRRGRSTAYRHGGAAIALLADSREEVTVAAGSSTVETAPSPVKVVTFPVGLSHEKYMRNSLLFSVGFVLPAEADAAPYEPVLRKLGLYLFTMEVESGFLFRPERKAALQHILPAILHGLNARGECFVAVDEVDTIALKLFPSLPRPPAVKDSDVPVRVRDLDVLLGVGSGQDAGLDLCIRAVLPHIDGVNFVRAIAEAADADISLVKRALQHLLYYGCIVMIDIFQYSNIYATQPRVQLLLRSRELSQACLAFVAWGPLQDGDPGAGDGFDASWDADPAAAAEGAGLGLGLAPVPSAEALLLRRSYGSFGDALAASGAAGAGSAMPLSGMSPMTPPPLSVDAVFSLYCAFGAGTRTCDVCAQGRTRDLGIHDRRLVAFGVMHGLLRRLHKYPVPVGGDVAAAAAAARAALQEFPDRSSPSGTGAAAAAGAAGSSLLADARSAAAARRSGDGAAGPSASRRPTATATAGAAAGTAATGSPAGLTRAPSTASTAAAAIERAAGRPTSAPAGSGDAASAGGKVDDDASSAGAAGAADAASGIDRDRERALRRQRASAVAATSSSAAAGAGSSHLRAASSGRLSASPSVSSVDGRSTISRGASLMLKDGDKDRDKERERAKERQRERERERRDKARIKGTGAGTDRDGRDDGSRTGTGAGTGRLGVGGGSSLALTSRRGAFDGDGDGQSDGDADGDAERSEFALQRRSLRLFAAAAPLLDGSRSLEELCCALCCSQSAVEECLERQGGFVYVLK